MQPQTKPRSDAYVGLLAIALLAQITGAVFFYLDWSQYPTTKPETPKITSPAQGGGTPAPPAPAPQGGGNMGGKAP